MNSDGPVMEGFSGDEAELALRLARLAPLMRELEQAEAELDPGFARTLRAQLLQPREQPPPAVAARPLGRPFWHRPIVWMSAGGAALLALLIGVLLVLLLPRPQVPTIAVPYPTRADLIYSFPAPPAVIRRLSPTLSLVHPRPGVPYAGHLSLTAPRLPTGPVKLRAYRLAPPRNVVAVGRRLYGIRSPARRVMVGSAPWTVAADGGARSHQPLHSLAVSLDTGELIYHDRRNLALPHAARALPSTRAAAVARQWLSQLGWPGQRMPLVDIESVPHLRKVREVEFGWTGVGRTAVDAATLWVTPDRSVIEAWVWPPVAQSGSIPARSVSEVWGEVRAGKLPLAVEGVPPGTRANGAGTLRRFSVVSILSPGRRRTLYVVPTYRFAGTAHIPGASTHVWFGLAPGGQK